MATLVDALNVINTLSVKDLMTLKKLLVGKLNSSISLPEYTEERRFANGRVCPICGCVHVVRNGHRKDGKQRFICRGCKKSFVITANSITAGTHKDFETWQQFIDCMMNQFSVRKSAEICDIDKNTAFNWRHKVLDALQNMQDTVLLDGIVEADETFFAVSFKGGIIPDDETVIVDGKEVKREPRHRGNEVHKRGISNEQICVISAVNRNGLSYAKIGKRGKVSLKCVSAALKNRIKGGATLCTDKEKAYRKFSKDNSLNLVQLPSGKSRKGIYHIQHINNYHSRLKDFIKPFNGVSTKYLNNYLVWYNLTKFAKETVAEKASIFFEFVTTTPKTVKCRELSNRPSLPLLV